MLDFSKTDLVNGALVIQGGDVPLLIIQEEGASEEQKAMFAEFRAKYPNGKPQPQVDPVPTEPVDEDKVAMAEALVDLTMQVAELTATVSELKAGQTTT